MYIQAVLWNFTDVSLNKQSSEFQVFGPGLDVNWQSSNILLACETEKIIFQ